MSEALNLKDDDKKYLISVLVSIVVGFVSYLYSYNLIYGISLATIFFLILVIIIMSKNHVIQNGRDHGIEVTYPNRDAIQRKRELELIAQARKNVKILGISHRTLWADTEEFLDALLHAGREGVEITFLILDPNGENIAPKASDEGDHPNNWKNDINSSISRFTQLKQDNPRLNINLYKYDVFPIWHMVIIDDDCGLIGYYPTGRPGSGSPLYLIKKSNLSILIPFLKYFESIKSEDDKIILKT